MLGKSVASNARNAANERLEQCFVDITTEISCLNKALNTIRRASKEAQVLKVSDFQITDDDGNGVEPLLLGHFENHIGVRFPNISKIIQQRLARAMLFRQKRILYMRYQGNAAIRPQKAIPKASTIFPAARPGEPSAHRDSKRDDS